MNLRKLSKALSIGLHVLDVMQQSNIDIKRIKPAEIKEAIGIALTTATTVKNAVDYIKNK